MVSRHGIVGLCLGVALLVPVPAMAQNVPLSRLLVDLVQADIQLAPPVGQGVVSHEAHFLPGVDQKLAPYLFNQQVVTQLATFPIGSSAGGFSYTFDPSLGTFKRATDSFGSAFSERALTNGKGRITLGTTFQHSSYSGFNGDDLDNGSVKFYLRHLVSGSSFFFEGDLIEAALKLKLSSSTTTIFANYGVTDRLDVSVAIPVVSVNMKANVDAKILRLATGDSSTTHVFPGGASTAQFSSSGKATGVGDIVLRTKLRLTSEGPHGLAAGLDLRLPTGDADNLLGTGTTTASFNLIGSSTHGRLSPHVNIGGSVSGSGSVVFVPHEFGYRFGTDFVASPRATLAVDVIGRTLIDAGRLSYGQTTSTYRTITGASGSIDLRELVYRDGALNLSTLALGTKLNIASNLLLTANVLVPMTSKGVTARATPVIGLDYAF